jgi:hypothetical protein
MTITAEFIDGPSRGTVQSYPDLSSALPVKGQQRFLWADS